jgi:hypothetical protein
MDAVVAFGRARCSSRKINLRTAKKCGNENEWVVDEFGPHLAADEP